MNDTVKEWMECYKIIVIVRGIGPEYIVRAAQALYDGGIRLMEITFDQAGSEAATRKALELVKKEFGGRMRIGAGTVMTTQQAEAAYESGAEYIISPNTDPGVISRTKELGMLSMPGALTPTEVAAAYRLGGDIIKLFPAGLWGVEYIKALRAPLSHIPTAAVGGISPDNVNDFLAAGVACVGVGGNLVNAEMVQRGDFAAVTQAAKAYSKQNYSI